MNLLKTISFIALIISSNSYAAQSYELGLGTNYGGVVGVTINTEVNSNVEMFAGTRPAKQCSAIPCARGMFAFPAIIFIFKRSPFYVVG